VAENRVVFKRDLKEESAAADRRSGSREFHTKGTAAENAPDAKYETTAVLAKRLARKNVCEITHFVSSET